MDGYIYLTITGFFSSIQITQLERLYLFNVFYDSNSVPKNGEAQYGIFSRGCG